MCYNDAADRGKSARPAVALLPDSSGQMGRAEKEQLMFVHSRVVEALDRKRDQFSQFASDRQQEQKHFRTLLEALKGETFDSLTAKLNEIDNLWPGALPTPELDRADGLCIPFGESWQNNEQAHRWARGVLHNRPVLAVDGSQIIPTIDYSYPVGAVQIGWFLNEHRQATADGVRTYEKDIDFEVLAPDELMGADGGDGDGVFPDWRVNQERFILESAKLCEFMEAYAHRPFEQRPVCFFDGSLIISFAGGLRPGRERGYIDAVEALLDCSERTQTPLVGFVDNAYSRDFVTLLTVLNRSAMPAQMNDAVLLGTALPDWGDRSPFWVCARPDRLSGLGRGDFYKRVCFCLARLNMHGTPARLELPRWLAETGRGEEIVRLVLAEAVVGGGYPYALETADVTAVIQQKDRQRFYRLFQEFLESQGLTLTVVRKLRSKQARR